MKCRLGRASRSLPADSYDRSPEMGFAAAATSLSYVLTYSNPTRAPILFKFAVKFALGVGGEPQSTSASAAG